MLPEVETNIPPETPAVHVQHKCFFIELELKQKRIITQIKRPVFGTVTLIKSHVWSD